MRSIGALLAVIPLLARGQDLGFYRNDESSGTVVGRVCLDEDGNGLCGAGEPGIGGARLLLDGGQAAVADEDGQFHFFAVPARMLVPGRSAYGGHALAMEGNRARTLLDLPLGGIVRADLVIPIQPAPEPPSLLPPIAAPLVGPQREGDRLRWNLTGRVDSASRIEVDGRPAVLRADGSFSAEVMLERGKNGVGLVVRLPDGRLALYWQVIHWVERNDGGDHVNPLPAQLLAVIALPPDGAPASAGWVLRGVIASGATLQLAADSAIAPKGAGFFAQWVPFSAAEQSIKIEARADDMRVAAVWRVAGGPVRGAIVGLADVELSFLGGGRPVVTGRGAAAMRGTFGPVEGEAGLDLDDRDRSLESLLYPRDTTALERQLDPVRTFLVNGDGSAEDDPNVARGRLYARLRAGPARLDLGSMRPGQTGTELGRYDRALFGAKLSAAKELGPFLVEGSVYGSTLRADSGQSGLARPAHEVHATTGGSLFVLRRTLVVAGSEAIRVEWRDPLTGLPTAEWTLVRGADYQIDYVSGWVLLAKPLATAQPNGALLTGDPLLGPRAFLVVDYTASGAGTGIDDTRGGRLAAAIGPVRIEGAANGEDRVGGSFQLLSGNARLDLGPMLRARVEVAQSKGTPFIASDYVDWSSTEDAGLTFVEPDTSGFVARPPLTAMQVQAGGETGGVGYSAWWRVRPRGYSDSAHMEVVTARELGGLVGWRGKDLELSALCAARRGVDPQSSQGTDALETRTARGRASYQLSAVRLTAEGLGENSTGSSGDGERLSAGLRTDWKVAQWLTLDASHHQSLSRSGTGSASTDNTLTAIGATASRSDGAISARAGWGPVLGPRLMVNGEQRTGGDAVYGTFTVDPDAPSVLRESASTVGARRRDGATELFTEDQFARDLFGLRRSRLVGAAIEPSGGLRLSANAESGTRIRLDGSQVSRQAGAVGASLVGGPVRLSGRGELRWEGQDRQTVVAASSEWKAAERLSVGVYLTWFRTLAAIGDASFFQGSVGGAYRGDDFVVLGNLAAIREQRPGTVSRNTKLASLATTLDVASRIAVGLGANLGLTRASDARADLLSGSGRVIWRFVGPFDAALEYVRRGSIGGTMSPQELHSVRLESGWSMEYGRFSAGYNLFGFKGTGVDPAEADRGRAYVRAEVIY